jgi:hypothetical protein
VGGGELAGVSLQPSNRTSAQFFLPSSDAEDQHLELGRLPECLFPFGLPWLYKFLHLNPPSLIFNFDFAAGFGCSVTAAAIVGFHAVHG